MIATTDVGCKNLFVYAENNPVVFKDSTGNFLDTIFDIASLVGSIVDVCKHPTDPWAWASLVGDTLDLIPGVTGVGEGTKALSATAKGSKYIDDVTLLVMLLLWMLTILLLVTLVVGQM